MKMVADSLGRYDDIKIYDEDIEYSTKALNDLAWDEESGYFGYTEYDESGNVTGIMRTADGENFNKGMDGVYPIVAGAVDGERKKKLLEHIKNPNEMWSAAGISAVDMSASYYFDDGYWNGNVWMSHQWFIWKTMLDNGEADFAYDIAKLALDMWKDETDFTYNTYECFGIATKRGGWFHNFFPLLFAFGRMLTSNLKPSPQALMFGQIIKKLPTTAQILNLNISAIAINIL